MCHLNEDSVYTPAVICCLEWAAVCVSHVSFTNSSTAQAHAFKGNQAINVRKHHMVTGVYYLLTSCLSIGFYRVLFYLALILFCAIMLLLLLVH